MHGGRGWMAVGPLSLKKGLRLFSSHKGGNELRYLIASTIVAIGTGSEIAVHEVQGAVPIEIDRKCVLTPIDASVGDVFDGDGLECAVAGKMSEPVIPMKIVAQVTLRQS